MNFKMRWSDFFTRPFIKKIGLSVKEIGASTVLIYVFAISSAGLVLVNVAERQMSNSLKGHKESGKETFLQYANSTALNQLSQLLGATMIDVDKSGLKFLPSSALGADTKKKMLGSNGTFTSAGKEKTWNLDTKTGKFSVDLCIKPEVKTDGVYNNADSVSSWISGNSMCPEANMVRTIITSKELIPAAEIDAQRYDTVRVEAESYYIKDSNSKYVQNARVNFLPATQQCDINTEKDKNAAQCSVDHCKFMQPHRDPLSGDIMYTESNGVLKMALSPNPLYTEKMRIKVNRNIPTLNADYNELQEKVEGDGVALSDFVNKALVYGLNDPFTSSTPQGVWPRLAAEEFMKPDGAGYVLFDLSAMAQKGQILTSATSSGRSVGSVVKNGSVGGTAITTASDWIRFEGFLYAVKKGSGWVWGSTPDNWRPPTPENMDALKNACRMTLGMSGTDLAAVTFCSRLNLAYARFGYEYSKLKRCVYRGPDLSSLKGVDASRVEEWLAEGGLSFGSKGRKIREWQVSDGYLSLGEEKFTPGELLNNQGGGNGQGGGNAGENNNGNGNINASANATMSYKLVSVSGASYKEPKEDYHINPDTFLSFPDVSFSDLVVKAGDDVDNVNGYRSYHDFSDIFTGTIRLTQSSISPNGSSNKDIALDFKADCSYEDLLKDNSSGVNQYHVFDQCFYIAYYKADDRLNCYINSPQKLICRNRNGCFTPDTRILMADKSYKAIKDVTAGEWVFNPYDVTQPLQVDSIVRGEQIQPMYDIQYKNLSGELVHLKVTHNHPLLTQRGMIQAHNLVKGDYLTGSGYDKLEVIRIDIMQMASLDVLNLELKRPGYEKDDFSNHLLVAEDIVSGDYYLQKNPFKWQQKEMDALSKFLSKKEGK